MGTYYQHTKQTKDNAITNTTMSTMDILSEYIDIPITTQYTRGGLNPSDILPYLQRKAVFQVLNDNVVDNTSCIGCEADHFGSKCETRCFCENGYCDDDLGGSGDCYCTLTSYGEFCRLCDGLSGSCPPDTGIGFL